MRNLIALTVIFVFGLTACSSDEITEPVPTAPSEQTPSTPTEENPSTPTEENPSTPIGENAQLKITVGSRVAIAILYDNPTSRDLVALLPLTVDMTDYASTEKIFYPATKLSTSQRHAVTDPAIGDINVYAPWGNVAIFYKSYSGSRELIRIGRITQGIELFSGPGTVSNVTFELVEP